MNVAVSHPIEVSPFRYTQYKIPFESTKKLSSQHVNPFKRLYMQEYTLFSKKTQRIESANPPESDKL